MKSIRATLPYVFAIDSGTCTLPTLTKKLRKNKATVFKMLNRLQIQGLTTKLEGRPAVYSLTEKGKELVKKANQKHEVAQSSGGGNNLNYQEFLQETHRKPKSLFFEPPRFHALMLKFPVIDDKKLVKWHKSVAVNNWIRKLYFVEFPIKLTIERTTKSIILRFGEKSLSHSRFFSDLVVWVVKGIFYSYFWLKNQGIEIDFSGLTLMQHSASVGRGLEESLSETNLVELDLNRKASSVFPNRIPAKAWVDWSKGAPEFETNDLLWQEKFLGMPEEVFLVRRDLNQLYVALAEYGVHLKTHTAVMKKMDGVLGKLDASLDGKQTRLKE